MIVQVLAGVAPKFRGDNPGRFRIVAMNAEVDGGAGIEDTHFRLFRGGSTLERLALPKIRNGFGGLPKRIVEGSIELRRMLDRHRLRQRRFHLGSRRERTSTKAGRCAHQQKRQDDEKSKASERTWSVREVEAHPGD